MSVDEKVKVLAEEMTVTPIGECTCCGEGTCAWCAEFDRRSALELQMLGESLLLSVDRFLVASRSALDLPLHISPEKREHLGMLVRAVWVAWAKEQPNPKASWLLPWGALTEPDREVDRRVGERLYELGFKDGCRR